MEITEEQFYDEFKPLKNTVNKDAPDDGCMYETFGAELDEVLKADKKHIWTLVEGDEGEMIICAGYHLVNRLGHYITEKPWKTGDEEYIDRWEEDENED